MKRKPPALTLYQDRVSEIHTRLRAVAKPRDGPAVTLGKGGSEETTVEPALMSSADAPGGKS